MATRGRNIRIFADATEQATWTGDRSGVLQGELSCLQSDNSLWVYSGSAWVSPTSGASGYTATTVGQVLYSQDGSTFAAEDPMTSTAGWLVNNDGLLLIL